MSVDDATWSEIRRCYSDSDEPVAALAARFGVSLGAIRYRIRRDRWPPRPKAVKKATATTTKPPVKRARRRRRQTDDVSPTSEQVVGRLYRAIVTKLSRLEDRMEGNDQLTPADSERETRELSTMVRSFEKVTGVAADIAKERKPKTRADTGGSADAQRMGLEIAERLEALNRQWESDEAAGKPK